MFALWPNGRKRAAKMWEFFSKEYNDLAFLCNGTDRHENLAAKSQSVSSIES